MSIEDIIREVIRGELKAILVPYLSEVPPAIVEEAEPVEEGFFNSQIAEETPVKQTVEIENTADLMAQLKEMASSEKGLGARAKKILIENYEYEKFSQVPDDEAQTVYNKVMELL